MLYLSYVSKLFLGVLVLFLFCFFSGGLFGLLFGVFVCGQSPLLNKGSPIALQGSPYVLLLAVVRGHMHRNTSGDSCSGRGQLDPPRLLCTEPRTPISEGMCEDVGWVMAAGVVTLSPCHLVPSGASCQSIPGSPSCWSLGPLRQDLVQVLQPGITSDAGGDGVRGIPGREVSQGACPSLGCGVGGLYSTHGAPGIGLYLGQSWGGCDSPALPGGSTIETEKEKHFSLYQSPPTEEMRREGYTIALCFHPADSCLHFFKRCR